MKSTRCSGGVGLIHLLVVLALVGALSLVAAPSLSSALRHYVVRGAALQLYGELQNARVAATTENNRFRVGLVDGSTDAYFVHDDDSGDGVVDVGETERTGSLAADVARISVTSTGPVVFRPNGMAVGSERFTLTGDGGLTLQVHVSRGGRVRIE